MDDFFISYNKADKDWAEWIAWQLEEEGYSTFHQAWDFRPSSNWVKKMNEGAAKTERTIAVLSPDYLRSEYTMPEWAAAFAKDPTGEKGLLLPIRVRECELEGLLPQVIYIDLCDLDEQAAKKALLDGVKRGRAKPDTEPKFPGKGPRTAPAKPRFPGPYTPTWNVPHNRNPNFTGRKDLLTQLKKSLKSGQPTALTQAITGLGGIGKTQLALEYVYRHAADYEIVWWIRSEEPTKLAADYGALAETLDLPQKDEADQKMINEAVRIRLEQNPGWLLVFDNVTEPGDIKDYLPRGDVGHVIITSRNPGWRGVAEPLDVEVLPKPESVRFLLKRTGKRDKQAAGELAEALGNLPLALEQAGAYIESTDMSITEYLELYQSNQSELLKRGTPATDYEHNVATTWGMSFEAVKKDAPAGAALLNLFACLAPDDIPKELLPAGREHLPEALAEAIADPLKYEDALAALRRYSLISVKGDSIAVHRLVQAVTRDRLKDDGRKKWAEAAVCILDETFDFQEDDPKTWPRCARLLPHGLASAAWAESTAVAPKETGHLLNEMGLYLQRRAEFGNARGLLERGLEIDEAVYGPDHPEVAAVLNNLGEVLRSLGDPKGARSNYERALEIDEAVYGLDHPDVAMDLNNLGLVLKNLGDFEGARSNYERALKIDEAAYGPDHPEVATDLNNIGGLFRALGDPKSARTYYERALEIDEAVYGLDHPDVATILNNLGGVLQDLGDLEGARSNYERALEIGMAVYGPDHPDVAIRLNNLGLVLNDLGDLKGARSHLERALEIDEAVYGPNHPDVATSLNNLGLVLKGLGDPKSARTYYERALEIDEAVYGLDHPKVATTLNNVGMVHQDLGDLEGARSHLERALKIDEAVYGSEHPEVAKDLNNLGLVFRDLGDSKGARSHLERALEIIIKFYEEDHPHILKVKRNLESLD